MQIPKVYTPDEASHLLKIGKSRFYELIRQGKVKVIRNGRRYIIPESSLMSFIESELNNSGKKGGIC